MLVDKRKDKKIRNYKCDRCEREINSLNRVGIFISIERGEVPRKKWDLCSSCYKALVKGIERGVNR